MRIFSYVTLISVIFLAIPASFAQSDNSSDPLVRVLVTKGVLTAEEARLIITNASPAEQRDRLATLLRDKGVISASEFEQVRANAPASEKSNPSVALTTAHYKPINSEPRTSAPQPVSQTPPPTVIPAVAPVRLLGIEAPRREGLVPLRSAILFGRTTALEFQ